MRYLYVMLGGAAGSVLRYSVGLHFTSGTMLVNLTGSFLIGLVLSLLPAGSQMRPLLVAGFLGGYTTFSSFQWETFGAVQSGMPWVALWNVAGSVVLGYLACWAGTWLATILR